eukprot:1247308-Prymnesium_polylepis.1
MQRRPSGVHGEGLPPQAGGGVIGIAKRSRGRGGGRPDFCVHKMAASAAIILGEGQCRVIFCKECGTLADEPTHKGSNVECYVRTLPAAVSSPHVERSAARALAAVFEELVVVSESEVKQVGDIDVGSANEGDNKKARAVIKEACPKCKHPELEYYTMQCVRAFECRGPNATNPQTGCFDACLYSATARCLGAPQVALSRRGSDSLLQLRKVWAHLLHQHVSAPACCSLSACAADVQRTPMCM